jgi:hypothetical protein
VVSRAWIGILSMKNPVFIFIFVKIYGSMDISADIINLYVEIGVYKENLSSIYEKLPYIVPLLLKLHPRNPRRSPMLCSGKIKS